MVQVLVLLMVIGSGAMAGLVAGRLLVYEVKPPVPPPVPEDPIVVSRRLDALLAPYAPHPA